jgi:hypothetical protein
LGDGLRLPKTGPTEAGEVKGDRTFGSPLLDPPKWARRQGLGVPFAVLKDDRDRPQDHDRKIGMRR